MIVVPCWLHRRPTLALLFRMVVLPPDGGLDGLSGGVGGGDSGSQGLNLIDQSGCLCSGAFSESFTPAVNRMSDLLVQMLGPSTRSEDPTLRSRVKGPDSCLYILEVMYRAACQVDCRPNREKRSADTRTFVLFLQKKINEIRKSVDRSLDAPCNWRGRCRCCTMSLLPDEGNAARCREGKTRRDRREETMALGGCHKSCISFLRFVRCKASARGGLS